MCAVTAADHMPPCAAKTDLKPANCLMAENGSIKLADYNIARVITEPGEAMVRQWDGGEGGGKRWRGRGRERAVLIAGCRYMGD
jgi:hypothetical protein